MKEQNTSFGGEFIEALDAVAGRKLFTYAERKEFRSLDREGMASKLRSYGYQTIKVAKENSASELATVVADRYAATSGVTLADSSLNLSVVSLLNLL